MALTLIKYMGKILQQLVSQLPLYIMKNIPHMARTWTTGEAQVSPCSGWQGPSRELLYTMLG